MWGGILGVNRAWRYTFYQYGDKVNARGGKLQDVQGGAKI